MLYTLSNGKTIDIPVELYLDMTDEEVQMLNGINIGFDVVPTFYNSVLTQGEIKYAYPSSLEMPNLEDVEEYEPDLTEVNSEFKRSDLDIEDLEE
jgi:hypothetical protein